MIEMKKEGKCAQVDTLVSFDGGIEKWQEEAKQVGLQLQNFDDLERYMGD